MEKYLAVCYSWLSARPRDKLVRTLRDVFRSTARSVPLPLVFAHHLDSSAQDFCSRWVAPCANTAPLDLDYLLSEFCRSQSPDLPNLRELLRVIGHKAASSPAGRGVVAFTSAYQKMLSDDWRNGLNRGNVTTSVQEIYDELRPIEDISNEGKEWHALYALLINYSERSSFEDASTIKLPDSLSGRVLTGVVHVLLRINRLAGHRADSNATTQIRHMINHLAEPERTILQAITSNWPQ